MIISLILFKEVPNWNFYVALGIMLVGSIIIVIDTLERVRIHVHTDTITHTHDGSTHTHIIEDAHNHSEKELLGEIGHKSI